MSDAEVSSAVEKIFSRIGPPEDTFIQSLLVQDGWLPLHHLTYGHFSELKRFRNINRKRIAKAIQNHSPILEIDRSHEYVRLKPRNQGPLLIIPPPLLVYGIPMSQGDYFSGGTYPIQMQPYFLPQMSHQLPPRPLFGVPQPFCSSVQYQFDGLVPGNVSRGQHIANPTVQTTLQPQLHTREGRFAPGNHGNPPRTHTGHAHNHKERRHERGNGNPHSNPIRDRGTGLGVQQSGNVNHNGAASATAITNEAPTEAGRKSIAETATDCGISHEPERSSKNGNDQITEGVGKVEANHQQSQSQLFTPKKIVKTPLSTPISSRENTPLPFTARSSMHTRNMLNWKTFVRSFSPMTPYNFELQDSNYLPAIGMPQNVQDAGPSDEKKDAGPADGKTVAPKKRRKRRGRRKSKAPKAQDGAEVGKGTQSLSTNDDTSKKQGLAMQQQNSDMNTDEANIESSIGDLAVSVESNATPRHSSLQSNTFACAAKDLHA